MQQPCRRKRLNLTYKKYLAISLAGWGQAKNPKVQPFGLPLARGMLRHLIPDVLTYRHPHPAGAVFSIENYFGVKIICESSLA